MSVHEMQRKKSKTVITVALDGENSEAGATTVFFALMLIALLAVSAIAVDTGVLFRARADLQRTADASALAAAALLPQQTAGLAEALFYNNLNQPHVPDVVDATDIVFGTWSGGTFSPNQSPANAVRVTAQRIAGRGNQVPLFFARFAGIVSLDVAATAIATGPGSGTTTRFLVDDEMIDSDVPAIEQLAAQMGRSSDWIISDNDNDGFIDLPPGTELVLPTGQVGDEALFDISHPEFPFSGQSDPSFEDFLNYNTTVSWRNDLLDDEDLDPLNGVSTVSNGADYPAFLEIGCQVSPIYKSDVSALNPSNGIP